MKRVIPALFLFLAASAAFAQVAVRDPWVRATVPQQQATGAFMQLSSPHDARLVAARSPVAGVVEFHEMAMEGDVMKMRAVPAIELPAGHGVELRPGSYHIMLLGLARQLKVGEQIALTLVIEGRDGTRQSVEVSAPVRPLKAPAGGMKMH